MKNQTKFMLVTELPFAGKGEIKTTSEWKRVYGYDVTLPPAGVKFERHIEAKPSDELKSIPLRQSDIDLTTFALRRLAETTGFGYQRDEALELIKYYERESKRENS